METCTAIVDGQKFTAAQSAVAVDGLRLTEWLTTRKAGSFAPNEVEAIVDTSSLTVCLVAAPGLQYPHPAPASGYPSPDAEPTSAIVIMGMREEPTLDSVGPASKMAALMRALQS